MPIYEYKCRKCGELFEQFVSGDKTDADVKCPKCGAKNPERRISQVRQITPPSCAPRRYG